MFSPITNIFEILIDRQVVGKNGSTRNPEKNSANTPVLYLSFHLAIDQNLLSFWVLFSYEKYIRPVLLSILRVRYSVKMLLKDGRSEKGVGGWEKWKLGEDTPSQDVAEKMIRN